MPVWRILCIAGDQQCTSLETLHPVYLNTQRLYLSVLRGLQPEQTRRQQRRGISAADARSVRVGATAPATAAMAFSRNCAWACPRRCPRVMQRN